MYSPLDPRSKPVPAPWQPSIDAFTHHLAASGVSTATIQTRTDHLRRLARFLPLPPHEISADHLNAYISTHGHHWSREYRRSFYQSLRRFWEFATQAGLTETNPAQALPKIRPSAPCPRPIPEALLDEALSKADARTRLILRLASELGLRRGEIARIHQADISRDLSGYSLIVHGKGQKNRLLPLPHGLAQALLDTVTANSGWAFPNHTTGHHLTPGTISKLASTVLPPGWTLHTLRHAFSTRTYQRTHDLLAIKTLLGHSSPTTTQRYIHVELEHLRSVLDSTSR